MERLDSNAAIFVNGDLVGEHPTAFRPFICDIKPWLHEGENTLLVRLTAGVESVTELIPTAATASAPRLKSNNGTSWTR